MTFGFVFVFITIFQGGRVVQGGCVGVRSDRVVLGSSSNGRALLGIVVFFALVGP